MRKFLVVGAILVVAACGAPEFTYVKNSGQKTYFKVPHEWHETGTDSLDDQLSRANPDSAAAAARQQSWWSVAYDADGHPNAQHLVTSSVTYVPIVYVRVAQLNATQRNKVSLDMLRDIFLPVTEGTRAAAAPTSELTDFELVHDEVLTPANGLHGVRVIYDYELPNGVLHTFDETALLNNDSSTLYLLLIRCSTACYRERAAELDTIATSFTVRSS
jgi:hypothetical protein